MRYLGLDQKEIKKQQAHSAVKSRPAATSADTNNEIKGFASALKADLNSKKTERDIIVAQLLQAQNSQSSKSEQEQCRDLRKKVKDLHQEASPPADQVHSIKEEYTKFVSSKNLDEKPYLRPFVAFMDEQIQELEAKVKVKYTPKQAMAMYETKNDALAVMDVAGASLNLDALNSSELSKMSKTLTKMKDGFSNQALKLFPDLAPEFKLIDQQVAKSIDPEKAKLDLNLAKKPLEMANLIVAITTSASKGDTSTFGQSKIDLKNSMKDYYERVSHLSADVKKRLVGATDAD
jgi:hypothetical protein